MNHIISITELISVLAAGVGLAAIVGLLLRDINRMRQEGWMNGDPVRRRVATISIVRECYLIGLQCVIVVASALVWLLPNTDNPTRMSLYLRGLLLLITVIPAALSIHMTVAYAGLRRMVAALGWHAASHG